MRMSSWLSGLLGQFKFGRKAAKRSSLPKRNGFVSVDVSTNSERLEERALLAGFTPGNIVVLQANGTTSDAQSVSLLEFTTAGTLVQTINLDTTGLNRITQSGSASSEGHLSVSSDGRYLTLVGYDAAVGTSTIAGTTSAAANRLVSIVDVFGLQSIASRITNRYTTNNIRAAVSDGTSFWVSGADSTTGNGGVQYVSAFGGTASAIGTNTNTRGLAIANGQLYVTADTASPISLTFSPVGTGLPTSLATAITSASGMPPSSSADFNGVFLADLNSGVAGADTAYIANTTSINKYSFNGTSWSLVGSITGQTNLANLNATVSGGTVTIYGTRGSAGSRQLVSIVDNTGTSGSIAALPVNTLVNFGAGTYQKGVAAVPDVLNGTAGNDTFTLTAQGSGNWLLSNGTSSAVFTAAAINNLKINGLGGTDQIIVRGTSGNDLITYSGTSVTVFGTGTINLASANLSSIESFTVDAGAGVDTININSFSSGVSFLGGAGNDIFSLANTINVANIDGGADTDILVINGAATADTVSHVAGVVTVVNTVTTNYTLASFAVEQYGVAGNAGNDTFTNSTAATNLGYAGGADNDTFTMTSGATIGSLDGTDGIDTLDYSSYTTGVTVRLSSNRDYSPVFATDIVALQLVSGDSTIENIIGGSGNDILAGTDGDNVITGGDGNDLLYGRGGNDTINGGNGNDNFYFRSYADLSAQTKTLTDTSGTDFLHFGSVTDNVTVNLTLSGLQAVAVGELTLDFVGTDFERVWGGSGNDTITGNSLDNIIYGVGGIDTINGGDGADTIYGGDGNDILNGENGNDSIFGDNGDDTINGGDGDDTLDGRADNDTILGGIGNDLLRGGTGNDSLDGGADSDTLVGEAGNDTLIGGVGDDTYSFNAPIGTETDTLTGETGGADHLFFAAAITANITVQLNLAAGSQTVITGANTLNLDLDGSVFERVTTALGNDLVIGNALANTLTGGAGNDILVGLAGNDTLSGGTGRDVLIGGAGVDLVNGLGGGDLIVGGSSSIDTNVTALIATRNAWTSGSDYATRTADVTTLLGAIVDIAGDRLNGGSPDADLDLFFANLSDILEDIEVGETRVTI